MTFPKSQGDIILKDDYNYIQGIVGEIIGQGENGYGFSFYNSVPIGEGGSIQSSEWRNLATDLNRITRHITNVSDVVVDITTGSIITNTLPNSAAVAADSSLVNRYTCHPDQYFVDPITSGTVNYLGGTSTRNSVWGVEVREIYHTSRVSFPNRLTARWFFNVGSYIEVHTFDQDNGLNDIDAEWAVFFDHLKASSPYLYSRDSYVNWESTTTVYNSGTLEISITADIVGNVGDNEHGSEIDFTIYYKNNDSATLIVSPTVARWEFLV